MSTKQPDHRADVPVDSPSTVTGRLRPQAALQAPERVEANTLTVAGNVSNQAVPVAVEPTQVRRPLRATVRTALQVGIPTFFALSVVVPQIVQIVLDEYGGAAPPWLRAALLAVSAGITATAAVLARVMAIPAVEKFLRRHRLLNGIAAAPR